MKNKKNKFRALVLYRKQEVDMLEQKIMQTRQKINIQDEKIQLLKEKISSFAMPTNGTFSRILSIKNTIHIIENEIKKIINEKLLLIEKLEELNKKISNANIEYEKAKYLQKHQDDERKKQLEYREQLELDEIGQRNYV